VLVPARGHRINVERAGAGRPLVLVHGLGTPSVWSRAGERLARSFDLVSVDLPGFGASAPPPAALSATDHALLLEGILEALDLRNAVLCGISYGGQVSAMLAARAPERVTALALVCPSGLMTRYRFLRWTPLFRAAAALARTTLLRNEGSIRRSNGRLYADPRNQPAEAVSEFFRMISESRRRESWFGCLRNGAAPGPDFPRSLARIAIPTLILWGNNDRVIPVRFAHRFQHAIAGSRVKVFDRCGHALPLEKPAELCAALEEFLSQGPRRECDLTS
jgi:pimeloyl-ACP methyl ester carboxylesterase